MTLSTTTEARTHVDVVPVPHPGEILLLEFLKPAELPSIAWQRHWHYPLSSLQNHPRCARYQRRYGLALVGLLWEFRGVLARTQEEYDLWKTRQTTDVSAIVPWNHKEEAESHS